MNTHPTIEKIIADRNAATSSIQGANDSAKRDSANLDKIFTIFAMFLDHVVQELQDGTLKTEVQNHPPVQPIAGSVQIDSATSLEQRLEAIFKATIANKIEPVETQSVMGTVEVSNFPEEKEIKFPEYPKQVKADITSLPKYVGDKLDDLKRVIQSLPAPVVNVPQQLPPSVHVDMQSVVDQLAVLEVLLTKLTTYEAEEEPLDLSPVVKAMEAVQEQIKQIKFPIPNFQSSWQHSRQMQALDAATSYTYNAYGEVDTINVILADGTFTQTLTNATISTPSAIDGLTTHRSVTAKTAWVKTA